MSQSENSFNGNGKLYASKRHLYTEDVQPNCYKSGEGDKIDCASVPRHRIAGKQRMPPYIEAPTIKVPEPRKPRSLSRTRSTSQDRKKNGSQTRYQSEGFNERKGDNCLSACNGIRTNEPLLLNDALVMLVPKSYLPTITSSGSSGKESVASKDERKRNSSVSFNVDNSQINNKNGHILGKKVPPLYIPRHCHEMDTAEISSNAATMETSESEDENETPWGKKLPAIKVSRIKRDFDEDAVSIEAPEGTLPVCARCGVAVYLAEEKRAAGRRFHSSCFKCFLCGCGLDSLNLYERNQEVYCKPCYIRQFGPKGYDYGQGEGALRME